MVAAGGGVARALWERMERERLTRGWTKTDLSQRTGLTRRTLDNLQTMTRPPLPRTVHALADALGVDRQEAEVLAGLAAEPRPVPQESRVRAEIEASRYSAAEKQMLLDLLDVLDRANRPAGAAERPGLAEDTG